LLQLLLRALPPGAAAGPQPHPGTAEDAAIELCRDCLARCAAAAAAVAVDSAAGGGGSGVTGPPLWAARALALLYLQRGDGARDAMNTLQAGHQNAL
jgi:hypothetical protein